MLKWTKFIFLIFFLSKTICVGQSQKDLEKNRLLLLKEIQKTTTELSNTQKNKANTFSQFSWLMNQIQDRENLISHLNLELAAFDERIRHNINQLDTLKENLKMLELEYSDVLRKAYYSKLQSNWIQFLLSANGINDAFKRWNYLKQMENFQKRQLNLITETTTILEISTQELEREKSEKLHIIQEINDQNQLYHDELKKKEKLLSSLSANEKLLASTLQKQKNEQKNLDLAIKSMIEGINTGTKAAVNENYSNIALSGESKSFLDQRGQLKAPVTNGRITKYFGKQTHPNVKNIQIVNNGIDLSPTQNLEISTIFEGTVVGIQHIPGFKNVVLIKHGIFYSVYSNIETVLVERGDKVKTSQIIGRLSLQNKELHFEIWQEKTRLNPLEWITVE